MFAENRFQIIMVC